MWCDKCDYQPSEMEEKYMICPNCNAYIERNLPKNSEERKIVYEYSSKIIRLNKILSHILIPIFLLFIIFNVFSTLYLHSRYSGINDITVIKRFSTLSDSHYFTIGTLMLMSSIPKRLYYYFSKKYDLTTFYNIIFIIITFISNIIFFKFFMDVLLPYFYNSNIDYLTKQISFLSDVKKYSSMIKTEVSYRTSYIFYSSVVLMIVSFLIFIFTVYIFSRTKRLQEELMDEFEK